MVPNSKNMLKAIESPAWVTYFIEC